MRLRIVHETVFRYDRPARGLIQALRLTPRDHEAQHVQRWLIEPSVDGRLSQGEDGFGNIVHHFATDGPVEALTLSVVGDVETSEASGVVRGALERVPDAVYLRETELTAPDEAIRAFADDAATGASDTLDALHRLLEAVHGTIRFESGTTDTATRAAAAFAERRGVCQDFAQIFISAARHRGVPARYVAGYLHRGEAGAGKDAGHAWAEALVPGLGWVGFDPAGCLCPTEAHVRVAVGLDALGAAPVRGSRRGGGAEALSVRLRVEDRTEARNPVPRRS